VLRIVLVSTLGSVGSGILAGMVSSVALSTILAKWADGNVRDPNILLAGAVLLSMVAGIACIIPARHACAIDTMRALRHD
jgi:ABC-type antimicrobial peptide transport system permease subunit